MDLRISEGSGTNTTLDDQSVQSPTRRAKVWEYFQQELVEVDGVMKVVCKYCGTEREIGLHLFLNDFGG
jgi:hypothetical protein